MENKDAVKKTKEIINELGVEPSVIYAGTLNQINFNEKKEVKEREEPHIAIEFFDQHPLKMDRGGD